jgi:long-chain acyl-CoA synthetase
MYHVTNVAKVFPDKPAAIFPQTGRRMTFAELDAQANQAAQVFRQLGIGRGDCVGISINNRPELLSAMLGAQRIGAYYTLLSTKLSATDLAYVVEDSGCKAVVIASWGLA